MAVDLEPDFQEDSHGYSVDEFSPEGQEDGFYPDSEDGGDGHIRREDIYEESWEDRFEAARRAIKTKKLFKTERDTDELFHIYGDIIDITLTKGAGNLLHALVEIVKHTEGIEPASIKPLVERLVKSHPSLLDCLNKDGYNPIFMAIRTAQHQLVEYMISTCIEEKGHDTYRKYFNNALSATDLRGETCLHAALNGNLNPSTIKMLIKNANLEALAAQDGLGKTPMHLAMSFDKCTDERTDLIILFIKRDWNAIQSNPSQKTFLDLHSNSGLSIYREHLTSRSKMTRRNAGEGTKFGRNESSFHDKSVPRKPKTQTGTRDSGHKASAIPDRGRHAEKPGRIESHALDEREILRERKKAEEAKDKAENAAEAAQNEAECFEDNNRRKERATTGRDASLDELFRKDVANKKPGLFAVPPVNTAEQQEPISNTSIKRSDTARSQEKEKPLARPAATTRKSTSTSILTRNSNKILNNLKLHYMRTRNAEKAISFLYGTNMDDIQISFDYDRLPRDMPWDIFVKRFGADSKSGLKFDRVLQYVTFPYVEIQKRGRLADLERETERQTGIRQLGDLGRKDMKYFFDWLYKKNVRHIIKLSVEDNGEPNGKVHSDQAIQESLERFVVEHLDWQKVDLDPETILHISSKAIERKASTPDNPSNTELIPNRQLKQIYLRWSGSNAVLRAWGEPEGLPMLPQLQRIYLFKPPVDKMYDNPHWVNEKIRAFQTRLNASREVNRGRESGTSGNRGVSGAGVAFGDVEVVATELNTNTGKETFHNAPHATTSAPVQGINWHRWLDSTERFAGEMVPFWHNTVKDFLELRQNQGTQELVEDDIVLALIDDGVDIFDTALSNQVLEGKSFDFHDEKVRPSFSSAMGHGTVMASMILRVCPMVKIYPIRLRTYYNENGKNNIDSNYAARAIQAALDKRATIISMSWTLPMTDNKDPSKNELHAVLKKAVDRKVLMFCSAPDEGKFSEIDYPSGPWRERFFRIGAARADGTVFPWTNDDGITYVLPGVNVSRNQMGSNSFGMLLAGKATADRENPRPETGSSIATALAAGLAAMIIYCIKANILAVKTENHSRDHNPPVWTGIPDNGATLIADPDAMRTAFSNLGHVTESHFIQVWDVLEGVTKMLASFRTESLTPDAKLKRIEGFRDFSQLLWKSVN